MMTTEVIHPVSGGEHYIAYNYRRAETDGDGGVEYIDLIVLLCYGNKCREIIDVPQYILRTIEKEEGHSQVVRFPEMARAYGERR